MKCIWKVVRLLPEWLSQLEFHEIMLEIHKFLEVGAPGRSAGVGKGGGAVQATSSTDSCGTSVEK